MIVVLKETVTVDLHLITKIKTYSKVNAKHMV